MNEQAMQLPLTILGGNSDKQTLSPEVSNERREVRVFISSTFKDMKEERNYLIKNVFPKIRSICQKRLITFTDIDLRWGITEEQSRDGGAVAICLEEINRCRPYFIGLIGERYGWTPKDSNVSVKVPESLAKDVSVWCENGYSVTEMEMLYGVLNNPKQTPYSYFYFCDEKFTHDKNAKEDTNADDFFEKEDSDKKNKLDRLKEKISTEGKAWHVDKYADIEDLGEKIEKDLLAAIEEAYPENGTPDAVTIKRQKHEAFARARRYGYIVNEEQISDLISQLKDSDKAIVITGDMGSGKSSLLATLADKWHNEFPENPIISHYAGAGDDSSVIKIVNQILVEIKQYYAFNDEIPAETENLFKALSEWLGKIPEQKPLLLILDGINQYVGDTQRLIATLPGNSGSQVKILVSALPGQEYDSLSKRDWPQFKVPLLDEAHRKILIETYLGEFKKSLPDSLVKKILNSPNTNNPLYLKILLDELRVDAKHEELENRIIQYLVATSPKALYQQVIIRWELDYGQKLTQQVLRYIWESRYGLSTIELRDLIDGNQLKLSRFIFGVGQHLGEISGLHIFMHDALRQAVEETFSLQEIISVRQALIDYFVRLDEDNLRRLDEYPTLLIHTKQLGSLSKLIANLKYIYCKFKNDRGEDLLREYNAIEENDSVFSEYKKFVEHNYISFRNLPDRVYQEAMNWRDASIVQKEAVSLNDLNLKWLERVYPVNSEAMECVFTGQHTIIAMDWSNGGEEIALLSQNGYLHVINVKTKACRWECYLKPISNGFLYVDIKWSHDDEVIAVAIDSDIFYVWSDKSDHKVVYETQSESTTVSKIEWSENNEYLIVGHRFQVRQSNVNEPRTLVVLIDINGFSPCSEFKINTMHKLDFINAIVCINDFICLTTDNGNFYKLKYLNEHLEEKGKVESNQLSDKCLLRGMIPWEEKKVLLIYSDVKQSRIIDTKTMSVDNLNFDSYFKNNLDEWARCGAVNYFADQGQLFSLTIDTHVYIYKRDGNQCFKIPETYSNVIFYKHSVCLYAVSSGTSIYLTNKVDGFKYQEKPLKVEMDSYGIGRVSNEYLSFDGAGFFVFRHAFYSATGKYCIKNREDGKIIIVTVGGSQCIEQEICQEDDDYGLLRVNWSPDSETVVLIFSSKIVVFDVNKQCILWCFDDHDMWNIFNRDDGSIQGGNPVIAWSVDCSFFVFSWHDGLITFDRNTGVKKRIWMAIKDRLISSLAMSSENKVSIGYRKNNIVDIMSIIDEKSEVTINYKNNSVFFVNSGVKLVSFLSDEKKLLIITDSGEITIFDLFSNKLLVRYNVESKEFQNVFFDKETDIITMINGDNLHSILKLHV